MKKAFYFTLKALFVLKIFKFLVWLFGHVEKTTWLETQGWFQNLWRHNLQPDNEILTTEIFFLKSHIEKYVWFFNENVSHFIFYSQTKCHFRIAFTSRDVE